MSSSSVYVVAAKRTAFGAFGGKLKGKTATELGAIATSAAMKQVPENVPVDHIIVGNVLQTSKCAPYLARHVGIRAGLAIEVPALTINRLCGSGFETVSLALSQIRMGDSHIVVAAGTESMSQAPHVVRDIRYGIRYGSEPGLEDSLAVTLIDQYGSEGVPTPMGITAENLASEYGINRRQCDEYAALSHSRWAKANAAGVFKDEIIAIPIKERKGEISFEQDEHPREETTADSIAKLKPAFKKDGVTTAANASGICDGAGALILASEKAVQKYNLKPIAKVVATHVSGVPPEIMGIGPVPAIEGLLKKVKLSLSDIDQIEVNEAFAAQFLAVQRKLNLDLEKTNIHGGAISLGHPLAASGSRILAHLSYGLRASQKEYAIGAACIGGGQGIAVLLQNIQ